LAVIGTMPIGAGKGVTLHTLNLDNNFNLFSGKASQKLCL